MIRGENTRNMGIDLLRALAMFFVICQHILGQGGVVANAAMGTGKYYFLSLLQILVYCSVDLFGLTTGYLMCQKSFRLSRLSKIWLTTVFWSVAVSCVFFVFIPGSRTLSEAISMFLPILRGRYWFFTAYFVTILVSPILNHVIRTLSHRHFKLLLAALFLIFGIIPVGSLGNDVLRISTGHHFAWMIVLYLIGGYLRTYNISRPKKTSWLLYYFLFALVHLIFKFAVGLIGFSNYGELLLTYPSPLVVGEAVCLFQFFKELGASLQADSLSGKLIRFIAPGVYSVYIIHVHPKIFWNETILSAFRVWDSWSAVQVFAALIITALSVFSICILLDAVRQRLFRLLHIDQAADRASNWLEQKVRAMIGS